MSDQTDDPRKWPPIMTAVAALQAIADLPTGANEDIERGREDAYRAVEALFAEPPEIEGRPITELQSHRSEGVAVKPLEWEKHPATDLWRAYSLIGCHQVYAAISQVSWAYDSYDGTTRSSGDASDIEAAMAAAQLDYATRIKSALEGWQPIETAPTAGKAFLVWCPDRHNTYLVIARFGVLEHFGPGSDPLRETPTLWQPLPEPPRALNPRDGGGQ